MSIGDLCELSGNQQELSGDQSTGPELKHNTIVTTILNCSQSLCTISTTRCKVTLIDRQSKAINWQLLELCGSLSKILGISFGRVIVFHATVKK